VSEASGNESLPSGMERKLLIRPLPAELLSETMLLLGGGNDIDLGDYIEENYLSGPIRNFLDGPHYSCGCCG
jgi:hypothetical protein